MLLWAATTSLSTSTGRQPRPARPIGASRPAPVAVARVSRGKHPPHLVQTPHFHPGAPAPPHTDPAHRPGGHFDRGNAHEALGPGACPQLHKVHVLLGDDDAGGKLRGRWEVVVVGGGVGGSGGGSGYQIGLLFNSVVRSLGPRPAPPTYSSLGGGKKGRPGPRSAPGSCRLPTAP